MDKGNKIQSYVQAWANEAHLRVSETKNENLKARYIFVTIETRFEMYVFEYIYVTC